MGLHGTCHVSKLLELGMSLGDLIWKTIQHVLEVDVRRVAGFYIANQPTNFGLMSFSFLLRGELSVMEILLEVA